MKLARIAAFGAAIPLTLLPVIPSRAQAQNPPFNPNHYQCYKISEAEPFKPREVRLKDQFGSSTAKLVRPVLLCAPTDKNGVPARDRRTHLVCYEGDFNHSADKLVGVRNQFGDEKLKVGSAVTLCVPSLKQVLPQ
jgi:hypothetical protein